MTQGSIARELVDLCARKGLRVAVAESCTGGGVGAAITAVAGASAVFLGGVISYSNEVKERVLGVKASTLASVGAVSEECALEMADGVRRLLGADVAVSVTGIAGPGGGTAEKPVGLVWFAVSTREATRAARALFDGGRDEVRREAVSYAMELMLKAVRGGIVAL